MERTFKMRELGVMLMAVVTGLSGWLCPGQRVFGAEAPKFATRTIEFTFRPGAAPASELEFLRELYRIEVWVENPTRGGGEPSMNIKWPDHGHAHVSDTGAGFSMEVRSFDEK